MKALIRQRADQANWQRIVACLVPFYFCIGCTTLPDPQKASLIRASELYENKDCAEANSRLNAIINEHGQADEIAEAYYLRGLCRMKSNNLTEAAADFEQAIAKSKRDDLPPKCRASLATIAYRQGNWAQSADLYDQALSALPDEPPTDELAYAAGVAMQRAGRWKDATSQFGRVLRVFPNSSSAANARRMVAWTNEYYTIQLALYAKNDAAAKAVQTYRARKLDAAAQPIKRDGRDLTAVTTGRYANYNEAVTALDRIRQIEPKAFVLP